MKKSVIICASLLAAAALAFPASAAITADFSYSVDSSNPLTIHFTDKSAGNPSNWFWQFNDGGSVSTERNPTFTFSGEGEYRVSFTAQSSDYSEENTAMKWITVTRSGVTEDNGGSSSSGGVKLPELSFGGINIPNPVDLIGEYIKLIRVMIIPANYQK